MYISTCRILLYYCTCILVVNLHAILYGIVQAKYLITSYHINTRQLDQNLVQSPAGIKIHIRMIGDISNDWERHTLGTWEDDVSLSATFLDTFVYVYIYIYK